MSDRSKIEWTDASWNVWRGCTKVSPGCAHCYAERLLNRPAAAWRFTGRIEYQWQHLDQPLRWRRPRLIFVQSMGDLFHEAVPGEHIDRVLAVMREAPRHVFQVLTKRARRMREYFQRSAWGLPSNVWLGVSVENQRWTSRIDDLLQVGATVCFVSCEPLLEAIDLRPWLEQPVYAAYEGTLSYEPRLDWVIVGGESGGPEDRRLVRRCWCRVARTGESCLDCSDTGWEPKEQALKWVRSLRDQCQQAGVAFFFKGWGGPRATSGGRLLDGRVWDEMPAAPRQAAEGE